MLQYPENGCHIKEGTSRQFVIHLFWEMARMVQMTTSPCCPLHQTWYCKRLMNVCCFNRGSAYKVEKGEWNEWVLVQKISTTFGIYMHTPTQHSANQNGAASKKAHGVDSLNGQKCTELGTHPYASSPRQPYKKFRGDPPKLAGIRPENWFLDRSLPWGYQNKTPSCE